jgi:hypothetical protein
MVIALRLLTEHDDIIAIGAIGSGAYSVFRAWLESWMLADHKVWNLSGKKISLMLIISSWKTGAGMTAKRSGVAIYNIKPHDQQSAEVGTLSQPPKLRRARLQGKKTRAILGSGWHGRSRTPKLNRIP